MTKMKLNMTVGLLFSLALVLEISAVPQERKMKMSELPAPVRKTVEEQTKGATIKGISSEKENGKIQYEVETLVEGKSRDIIINTNGSVAEVEEQVELSSLAAEVQKGIYDSAGSSKILRVEAVTKGGVLAVYEVGIQNAASGKKSEFQVKPDGTLVPKKRKT